MRSLPLLLVALAIVLGAVRVMAQQARCLLVDATTGDPISYVNVYVPALATGVVSDAMGRIQLSPKLASAPSTTPIQLSCIGYAAQDATLADVRGETGCTLPLQPTAYELASAEVTSLRYEEKANQLGFRRDQSNVTSSYSSEGNALGAELGNVMRAKGSWLLTGVGANLHVDTATVFEVNVYSWRKGKVGERLHDDRIFVDVPTCTTKEHAVAVDVGGFSIRGSGDFLVSFEVVGWGSSVSDSAEQPVLDLAVESSTPIGYLPTFNSKLSLRSKQRITRYRKEDGVWQRTPLGVVAGVWAMVRENK